MSIIEKLLDQKVVIISLIAIGMLMLVVLLLIMNEQLTVIRAKRRQHQARLRTQQLTQSNSTATRNSQNALNTAASNGIALPNIGGATQATPSTAQSPDPSAFPDEKQIAGIDPLVSTNTAQAAETSTAQPEAQVSNAMQDILSSVFVDEDVVARYEVLLRGLDPVDSTDLLVSCRKVLAQLRARNLRTETHTDRG